MDTIVNPLRQVGHTMKQVPDSVVDGVHKVKGFSDGLGRALNIRGVRHPEIKCTKYSIHEVVMQYICASDNISRKNAA